LQGKRLHLQVEGRGKQEETMLEVAVYHVDYGRKIKDPIGTVFEKRETERANNYLDLLWLARRLFASDSADALHIVIDLRHAREASLPELIRECSAG
jgi:hypothetical protein